MTAAGPAGSSAVGGHREGSPGVADCGTAKSRSGGLLSRQQLSGRAQGREPRGG
jgi:hypothetical protein